MAKRSFDVRFIRKDTQVHVGRLSKAKWFVSFSPFPVESRAAWIGICPETEEVARSLANWFEALANQMKKAATADAEQSADTK